MKITFYITVLLGFSLWTVLRRRLKRPILTTLGTCMALFIPMLFGVGAVVDSVRYGEFKHEDTTSLNDAYVKIPRDATDITLHKYASGHFLKFSTSEDSLQSWMDELTEERRKFDDASPFEITAKSEFDKTEFNNIFKDHGWLYPEDVMVYRGWRSRRGGGFDVWYSEAKKTAFISAGYW